MKLIEKMISRKRLGMCIAGLVIVIGLAACGGRTNEAETDPVTGQREADISEEGSPEESMQAGDITPTENNAPDSDSMPEGEDMLSGVSASGEESVKEGESSREEGDMEPLSDWAGKKVTICGDSISTFTGYIPDYYSKFYPEYGAITDVNDTWWMQVINRTGMELCRNASYSGSTVSGQSQDNHDGRFSCGNQRIADLASTEGEWPDVIIILMGTNDLLNDIPLGAYDGASEVPEGNIETFSEAYALMLDKMRTWYPEAEIYCCTIAEVSRWSDEGDDSPGDDSPGEKFPYKNVHGLTAKDYNAWIKSIAQAKNLPVIDVYECGITYENAKEYTSDGTHPNVEGAKLIADKVCEFFG